ncbi:hypothetical protein TNCV_4228591 [Trichonephila clavipes]|nr:hypothetical protein TNCV_4228591 [Trichonephila clavipes]
MNGCVAAISVDTGFSIMVDPSSDCHSSIDLQIASLNHSSIPGWLKAFSRTLIYSDLLLERVFQLVTLNTLKLSSTDCPTQFDPTPISSSNRFVIKNS